MRKYLIPTAIVGGVLLFVLLSFQFYWCRLTEVTNGPILEFAPSPSPDGRWLAFAALSAAPVESNELWVQSTSLFTQVPRRLVSGSSYDGGVSWSPNSNQISYIERVKSTLGTTENQVFLFNLESGQKSQLTFGHGLGIGDVTSWSVKNEIAFLMGNSICTISPNGGGIHIVGNLDAHNPRITPDTLAWSPNGERIAFSGHAIGEGDEEETSLWILDVKSGGVLHLTSGKWDKWPTWTSNETIIFSEAKFVGKPWSLSRLNTQTGKIEQLKTDAVYATPAYSAKNGDLYVARGKQFDVSGNDFNIFRGFHIFRIHTRWVSFW